MLDRNFIILEVSNIDASPSSIERAINLMLAEIQNTGMLPLSVQSSFFEALVKVIINLIGEMKEEEIKCLHDSLKQVLVTHREMRSPLLDLSPKQQLGAHVLFLYGFMEVYLNRESSCSDF